METVITFKVTLRYNDIPNVIAEQIKDMIYDEFDSEVQDVTYEITKETNGS